MSQEILKHHESIEIPKLSPEKIIDLKLRLLNSAQLVEQVAEVLAMEKFEEESSFRGFGRMKELRFAAHLGAQHAKVITELIALPGAEWRDDYLPPEEYEPVVALQEAIITSHSIPRELSGIIGRDLPQLWQDWEAGKTYNPLLSAEQIALLEANGYGLTDSLE